MSSATGLLRPRNLQVEAISANRARVVLEPLERTPDQRIVFPLWLRADGSVSGKITRQNV